MVFMLFLYPYIIGIHLNIGERACLFLALSELSCLGFRARSHVLPASICNPLITKNRNVGAVKEHEAQAAEYGTFEGNTSGFCADLRSGKACGGETRPFLHRISGCLRYKSYLIIIIYYTCNDFWIRV